MTNRLDECSNTNKKPWWSRYQSTQKNRRTLQPYKNQVQSITHGQLHTNVRTVRQTPMQDSDQLNPAVLSRTSSASPSRSSVCMQFLNPLSPPLMDHFSSHYFHNQISFPMNKQLSQAAKVRKQAKRQKTQEARSCAAAGSCNSADFATAGPKPASYQAPENQFAELLRRIFSNKSVWDKFENPNLENTTLTRAGSWPALLHHSPAKRQSWQRRCGCASAESVWKARDCDRWAHHLECHLSRMEGCIIWGISITNPKQVWLPRSPRQKCEQPPHGYIDSEKAANW